MTRKTTLVPLLLTAAALACSTLSGSTGDLAATETAVAAQVMTQLAPQSPAAPAPTTDGGQPATPAPAVPGGTPQFNPFADLTAEQEGCLRQAWGDDNFSAISTFQRPPSPEEALAMGTCGLPAPAGPAGTGQPGGGPQPGGTGQAPGGGAAVFKDQTFFTTSSDGLTWAEGILLAEKASVPEVIYTSKGEYWAYWVDFSKVSGRGTEKLGIAHSTDGANWEMLGIVQIAVKPPAAAAAVPEAMSSLYSSPGSRRWVCRSINPGAIHSPRRSKDNAPAGARNPLPIRVIRPSLTMTSSSRSVRDAGSRTLPRRR